MSAVAQQPIRVLQVLRPAVGGMKAHALQLATGLRDSGFLSDIACPGDSDMVQAALDAGLTVRPVKIVGPLHPVHDIEAILMLRDIIKRGRFEIVHAHGFKAGLVARVAAMLARCPRRIVTVHNHVLYRDIRDSTKRLYIAVERWLGRHTSRIITVSDALRDELVDEYGLSPRLVTTIHNGIDLTPFLAPADRAAGRARYGIPADALVIGCAARFAPQKAMDVLVAAAIGVLERVPNAWLLLGGDGPTLDAVRHAAATSGVADRIVFPGFESDVPTLLGTLDIYVSAALSEGLPLATIEAMAAGLPVVSTRAGGTPEVVEDGVTGLLAEPGDAAALTEQLLVVARDHARRSAMGLAGRARAVEEFDQDRMLERTAELYRSTLAGTRTGDAARRVARGQERS